MLRKTITFFFCCLLSASGFSQKVGIGTTSPNVSSSLDINSASSGLLIPRLTSQQRLGIVSPADGLLVFDTDKQTICMYNGAAWVPLMYSTSFNKLPPVKVSTPADILKQDFFGKDISISGNYAIIGAPFDTINGNVKQGSAYIYF